MTAELVNWRYMAQTPAVPLPEVPIDDPAEADLPAHLRETLDVVPVATAEGLTVDELAQQLGITRQAADQRVKALEALGLVAKEGAGTKTAPYRWTTARASAAPTGTLVDERLEGWNGLSYPPGFDKVAYRRTPHWRQVCREAMERCEKVCEECGQAQALDVHHLHYRSLWREAPGDVRPVCVPCHGRHNAEQRRHRAAPTSPWVG